MIEMERHTWWNVFGGREETTFFGQLDRSDNVFATVRYDF